MDFRHNKIGVEFAIARGPFGHSNQCDQDVCVCVCVVVRKKNIAKHPSPSANLRDNSAAYYCNTVYNVQRVVPACDILCDNNNKNSTDGRQGGDCAHTGLRGDMIYISAAAARLLVRLLPFSSQSDSATKAVGCGSRFKGDKKRSHDYCCTSPILHNAGHSGRIEKLSLYTTVSPRASVGYTPDKKHCLLLLPIME